MSEDRSREERPDRGDPGVRDPWYERLLHLVHVRSRDSIRHDLEDALAEADEDRTFSPQERAMLKNVLNLHRLRVDDVMVPRADVVAVPAEATLGQLLGLFRTAAHSRLPVYGETLDDPKGMVHIRDFLDFLSARAQDETAEGLESAAPDLGKVDLAVTLSAAKIWRPVLFVPPSMPAMDLLVRMQATRTHMALVIDEYGGTDGLVSIEDLIEMVVGDIEDEHDVDDARMIVRADETWIVDARASLEEVAEATGAPLAAGDLAEEVDTIGGLVVTLAGRVPSRGELIAGPAELEFEVLDADPRRVKRVRIHTRTAIPGDGGAPPSSQPGERAALARPEPRGENPDRDLPPA
jgi:CBS domain containing-hemolysin-like protein